MAYNRRNYLERVLAVQQIVLNERENGATFRWIYKNKIKKKFRISYSTFNNYLGIPASKELKKLEQNTEYYAEISKN